MKKYSINGDLLSIVNISSLQDNLEKRRFYDFFVSEQGIFLKKMEKIKINQKFYGSDLDFVDHIKKTWSNSEEDCKVVGVSLIGKKGLGKSYTAARLAYDLNLPIIRIKSILPLDLVLSLLRTFEEDFILFIDEFEKLFSARGDDGRMNQEMLLNFLDGGVSSESRCLFLTTLNEGDKVSEYLRNRPSRIRYIKEYNKLSEEVIVQIIDDLLKYPEHKKDLLENLTSASLNIDVLVKIIQEINYHNKPYSFFKDFFNFKDTNKRDFKLSFTYLGEEVTLNVYGGVYYTTTSKVGNFNIPKLGLYSLSVSFKDIFYASSYTDDIIKTKIKLEIDLSKASEEFLSKYPLTENEKLEFEEDGYSYRYITLDAIVEPINKNLTHICY